MINYIYYSTPDVTPPTITNVSSSMPNGTYTVGTIIDIDVTFSESVTSTGDVTVTLETGDVDRTCTFTVTESITGTCNYIIQQGDSTSDLQVGSISGVIKDTNTIPFDMTNFVPTTNLAANKALVIETIPATITSISSDKTNGTYTTGEVIDIDVTFSKTVTSDWKKITNAGSRAWNSIASSSDGAKLAAVVSSGYIYTSTDSGITWTERTGAGSRSWYSIASSSDGTKLVAGSSNYIYISTDSGVTWTEITNVGSRSWLSVASSSDGTKLAAVYHNNGRGFIFISSDSGNTWYEQSYLGPRAWNSIASSSNGTKLVATTKGNYDAYIYTSTDGGNNWISRTGAGYRYWYDVASSDDGTKIVAVVGDGNSGYIYTSTDSGVTWTERTSAGSRNWISVTSSSDGTKLAATYNGYIYTSTDSGITWTQQTSAGSLNWYSIASSSDGTKLFAVANNDYIYSATPLNSVLLTLETGDIDRTCTFMVTSSTTGTCNYTVQPGDVISDLTVKSISGNFYDAAGNQTTDFTIGTNLAANKDIVIDASGAYVSSASSDKANGSYTTGEVIDIDITFSEAVTSTGDVTVTLETGDTDRTCTFQITGSTTGTCNYTVLDGDKTDDLTVKSITGTIKDSMLNELANTTPVSNLSDTKDILIDTRAPIISNVNSSVNGRDVTITWTTDDLSSSIVEYGKTTSYGTLTTETDTPTGVTSHSVVISDLEKCSTYHFRVISKDVILYTATGSDNTFDVRSCSGGGGGSSNPPKVIPPVVTPTTPISCPPGHLFSATTGQPCTTYTNTPPTELITKIEKINKTIKPNTISDDIRLIQVYLNTHGYIIALTGPGSLGNETTKFGGLTKKAVIKFQLANGLKGDGVVGPMTLKKMKELK